MLKSTLITTNKLQYTYKTILIFHNMLFTPIILCLIFTNKKVNKDQVLVRKEIRDLSVEEWETFKQAVIKLKQHGFFEELAEIHLKHESYAHNTPRFLPWHRAFLLYFENLLQIVNNNYSLTVPYWDWTIDCEDPELSPIFMERFWGIKECFEVMFPKKHCLKRNKSPIDPFYSKLQINMLINKKMKYDHFRESLELVPHAIVHFNIGGKNGDMSFMFSTNDPIFWHHHSYVDYIWHKKQIKNLGESYVDKKELKEVMSPFKYKIEDIMNLDKCKRVYKEYVPMKFLSMPEMKITAGKISEEYAVRHNYDIKKIREIEDYLESGRVRKNWVRRFISLLLKLF